VIGSVRGTVLDRSPVGEVLVEVHGLGYRVTVSPRTLASLTVGQEAFLHVHHHVKEDGQSLYGFPSLQERVVFESLLAAHRVGPSLALAILATHPPDELRRVVADADVASLCLVPGVGKQTAARLLIELKGRLDVPELDVVAVATGAGGSSALSDVREALGGLGYGPDEIRDVLREVPSSDDPATLLREALRLLGARRA
jgi:Holliday junction DNA helicase RuvA